MLLTWDFKSAYGFLKVGAFSKTFLKNQFCHFYILLPVPKIP